MENINYSELLFNSVDQIVTERLKQIQYDRTIVGEVVSVNSERNEYMVNCEGLKIKAYASDPNKQYREGNMVHVLIPNGDYEQTKLIIGSYTTENDVQKSFKTSYDNFVINYTFPCWEYKKDEPDKKILPISNDNNISSINIATIPINQTAMILPYDIPYDYIGIHWKLQTYQLFWSKVIGGNYAIQILFIGDKKNKDGTITTEPFVVYDVATEHIYGNPYSLTEEFDYYNLFEYNPKIEQCHTVQINLIQNGDFKFLQNQIPEDMPSIEMFYTDLSFGYDLTKADEQQAFLLDKNQSLNYRTSFKGLDTNDRRDLYLDWRLFNRAGQYHIFNYLNFPGPNEIAPQTENYEIYWLHYQEGSGDNPILSSIDGTFNWQILEKNVSMGDTDYERHIRLDVDYQTDQYKILLIYPKWSEDEEEYETVTIFTEPIVFENLELGIQPGTSGSVSNSLKLILDNSGIYNLYGLDGLITDRSKQGPYTITASFLDALGIEKISSIKWTFPLENTMIEHNIPNQEVDCTSLTIDEISDLMTRTYKIKSKYYPSATFNIIQCDITLITGEKRSSSIALTFGELGNSGTSYAFNLDFLGEPCLYLLENEGDTNSIQVSATLSKDNGETILLSDFANKLKWSWLFPKDENNNEISSLEGKQQAEIFSSADVSCKIPEGMQDLNIVELKYDATEFPRNYSLESKAVEDQLAYYETKQRLENAGENIFDIQKALRPLEQEFLERYGIDITTTEEIRLFSNYSILECRVQDYNTSAGTTTDLIAYLSIPLVAPTLKGQQELAYPGISGATRIVYDALGTSATYSTEDYALYYDNGDEVTDLVWQLQKDSSEITAGFPTLRAREVQENISIEEPIEEQDEEPGEETPLEPIKKYKYRIIPASYMPNQIPPVCIVAFNDGEPLWLQPILIIQNVWINETVNEWNGVLQLETEGTKGSILSPLMIAGRKEGNNLFSGVMVGQIDLGNSHRENGVYGFKQGQARFWLNERAEFFIGNGETRNIHLDSSGNFSIIANNFNLEANNLKLNSANDGEIMIGNEDYYLKFGGSQSTGLDIKTNKFILDTLTLDIDTEAEDSEPILIISGRANIGGWNITEKSFEKIYQNNGGQNFLTGIQIPTNIWNNNSVVIAVAVPSQEGQFNWNTAPFYVTQDGILHATGAVIDSTSTIGGVSAATVKLNAEGLTAEISRAKGEEEKLSASITATANGLRTEVNQAIADKEDSIKADYNSKFEQTATSINAKVSSKYDNKEKTFGWNLSDDEFSIYSNTENNKVLSVTANGLSVKGAIEATSLVLGDGVTIPHNRIEGLTNFVTLEELEKDTTIVRTDSILIGEAITENGLTIQNISVGGKAYTNILTGDFLLTNIGLGDNVNNEDGKKSYFLVDKDGLLIAKNAVIYGTIYATNGYFGGELQAATGTFKGSLNVEADEFKVRIGEEGLYAGTNNEYISLNKDKKLKIKTNEFHFTLGEEQPDYVEVNFDEEWYFLNWENYYIKDNNGNYIPNTSEEQDYDIIYYKKGQKFPTTNGLYCMRDGKNIFSVSEEGEINFGPKNSGFYYNETSGTVFNGWFTKYFDDSATEEEKADRCWFDEFYLESLNTPFDGLLGNGLKIYSYAYYNDLHPTAETDFFIGGGSYFKEDDYTDMWYTAAGIIYSNKNMYIYTEDEGYLYGTWWLNAEKVVQSDRNLKHDIENLLSNYETFFDNLMPVRYKYNNGTSNRYHIGLIAQDVEKAIEASGLTSQECAILVKDKQENYGLRYGELIALNTWQIQKLKTRVIELENEIKEIKKHYEI